MFRVSETLNLNPNLTSETLKRAGRGFLSARMDRPNSQGSPRKINDMPKNMSTLAKKRHMQKMKEQGWVELVGTTSVVA